MDKCPRCHKYTVAYDSYRGVNRCMVDGCSCIVIDENTYSYLRSNPSSRTIDNVKMCNGVEEGIIRKYRMA